MNSLVSKCEATVRERMADQGAGHGMDHVLRVLKLARAIQRSVGGDLEIIELATLLHDVGDAKFHNGVERSGEFAAEILTGLGAGEQQISHVVHIVDNLSFRKTATAEPLSLEGKVVQDADRLDALGAVGIVRTVEYGASIGQPFYCQDAKNSKMGIQHFEDKLFKLKDLMNTPVARELAIQREVIMRQFVEHFMREVS